MSSVFEYYKSIHIALWGIFYLSFIVGIEGGVYDFGGGVIIATFFV